MRRLRDTEVSGLAVWEAVVCARAGDDAGCGGDNLRRREDSCSARCENMLADMLATV